MRPLKLAMSAFGPYAGEQVIDFTELNGRNIFLITGPTGAGKTTIFDAICYAVYGKGSGRDRDGENMRSDFAADDVATSVELEFELNGRRYWVRRKPRQLRPKAKGGGYTEQGAEAEFKELSSPEAETIAGIREVSEKVHQVLGISYEQFKQIIMIPQGEFRELLTTESKDREGILQRIFGTEGFKRMQERLGDMEKTLRDEVKLLTGQQGEAVRRLRCEEDAKLAGLLRSPHPNIADITHETILAIDEDERRYTRLQEENERQDACITLKQQEIFNAHEVQRKLAECDALKQRRQELESRLPDYEARESALLRGRRTLALQGLEETCEDKRRAVERRQAELAKNSAETEELSSGLAIAQRAFEEELAKEPLRTELAEQIRALTGYAGKVDELETVRQRHRDAQAKLCQAEQQAQSARTSVDAAKREMAGILELLEELRNSAADFAAKSAELTTKRQLVSRVQKLQVENAKLQNFRQLYEKQQEYFKTAKETLAKQQQQHELTKQQFIQGQAGLLARALNPGEACPVCGSQHHPAPAALAEGMVSEELLRQVESKLQQAAEAFEKVRAEFEQLKGEGLAQRRTVENLQQELAGTVGSEIAGLERDALTAFVRLTAEQLEIEIAQLAAETVRLQQLVKQEQELSQRVKGLQQLQAEAEKLAETAAAVCTASLLAEQSERQQAERLAQEVPPALQSRHALSAALEQAEKRHRMANEAFRQSEESFRRLTVESKAKQAEQAICSKALAEAATEYEAARARLTADIAAAGFVDYEEYLGAKLTAEQVQEMDGNIQQYRQNLAAAIGAHQAAERAVRGFVPPDTVRLENELAAIRTEKVKLGQKITELYARIKHNRETLDQICQLQKALGSKEEEYGVIADLANTARGNNEEKLSFERYVLAAFFEDIIEAANLRLAKMSGGRYEMNRIRERGKGAAQSGLEIEVFDNYTGRARHIKTLSGGESFKASLALALGLADVVQAYAGGISLETMFIDEGFGTLDPESLDSAVQCLVELQHAGRLVGIISHVPELKACIDARLEIEAGKNGSRAKFTIV